MRLNRPLFEQRMAALRARPELSVPTLDALARTITSDDDWACFRLNPTRFAESAHLAPTEVLDVFLHAVRVGLLELRFNLLCPGCGAVEYQMNRVDAVPSGAWHCIVCDRDVTAELDDRVEVSFSTERGVRELDLKAHETFGGYFRFHFSSNFERSEAVTQFITSLQLGLFIVPPSGEARFSFDAVAGQTYRVLSLDAHSHTVLTCAPEGVSEVEVGLRHTGLTPASVTVKPGGVSVRLVNFDHVPIGALATRVDLAGLTEALARGPSRMKPFLTAKALLNTQTFRDLFRAQSLDADLQLQLRSLTLLFTDLKGSTELYDRSGDLRAYRFVRDHFRVLSDAVKRHRGAIIKTMGDAIMASFNEPTDATLAAVEMMEGMKALEAELQHEGHHTGLKVGLHEGPALAVTAEERLDYFGQTVNIAARVQALAQAGEIWVTTPVMEAPGVRGVLQASGWHGAPRAVSLKGVGGQTEVFQLHPRS